MEDRPMYLGLIHVVNTQHEHQHSTEHTHGEGHSGSALQQLAQWLGRIFRGGSVRVEHEKASTKRN
jgi:hypothetical protein